MQTEKKKMNKNENPQKYKMKLYKKERNCFTKIDPQNKMRYTL